MKGHCVLGVARLLRFYARPGEAEARFVYKGERHGSRKQVIGAEGWESGREVPEDQSGEPGRPFRFETVELEGDGRVERWNR